MVSIYTHVSYLFGAKPSPTNDDLLPIAHLGYTKLRTTLSEFENVVRKMSAISSAPNVLINYTLTLQHIYRRCHLAIYTPWKIDPHNDQIFPRNKSASLASDQNLLTVPELGSSR